MVRRPDHPPIPAQRGFALISAILLAFVILSLVTAWLTLIMVRNRKTTMEQNRLQAEYIARSGLVKAGRMLTGQGAAPIDLSKTSVSEEDLFLVNGGRCRIATVYEYGYLKAVSTGHYKGARHTVSVRYGINADSLFPEALIVADPRGVILESGSSVLGDIRSSIAPQNWGADWRGAHRPLGEPPQLDVTSYSNAIAYYQERIANPHNADVELHSPQVFDERNPLPEQRVIYVNDNVLLTGRNEDDPVIFAGPKTIISTADIQVSGWARLINIELVAAGKVSLLDRVKLTNCDLFSARELSLTDEANYSGNLFSLMDLNVSGRTVVRGGAQLYSAGNPSGKITIGEQSSVSGTIILAGGLREQSGVFVEDEARINGVIYGNGRVSIAGSVSGAVIAAQAYRPYADSATDN
ncbi:hypothetical protein EG831_05360, partial [bacterium]|nr:hypothetical protein [bacterium]